MTKKPLLVIVSIVIILIAVLLVSFFVSQSQNNSKPKSLSGVPLAAMNIKQALALRHTATCLSNDSSLKTTVESLPGLDEDSGIYTEEIDDVPAGTNVDVSIASYDSPSSTVGGSLLYSNQYGSYNFLLQKQNDGWRYIAFIRCG